MRHWRTSLFGDSLLRTVCRSVHHSRARQFSEPLYQQIDNVRNNKYKFKGHPYATYDAFKCWNCQTVLDIRPCLFCKNCSIIQSSEDQNLNYFELFNINVQYDIDTVQLTSNFRKLQNLMHPDRFSNKTEVNFTLPMYLVVFTLFLMNCVLGRTITIRIIFFSVKQILYDSIESTSKRPLYVKPWWFEY